ncbi:Hachiman antiphage defense system protein HamA [Psychroserpens sp. NJDZ02]|uniref:Hachiman antiphage defense system protein HamA n=1 Tax=Psychroserpens sp. NJDZ02 TaxID=2570561 RepID=UPI0010A8971B|nr:Hachiman antiphage defense system protein HamA [Psychroserpens sp. NJDZ02]QCE42917.1 DUF1837 domain-containing protein [Psychroserpens sp. NJDZ02]
MTKQTDLIGNHPNAEHPLGAWLKANDIPATATKCHRELTEINNEENENLILWMAKKIISHHYDSFRLEQLKKKYAELGFPKYAEQNRKLPIVDKVKKGNATEIILIEYIQSTLNKELTHAFKLRYNPNVDQAIKGDDTLLVDLFQQESGDDLKIYLGESKFRKIPDKTAVNDISFSLEKEKMPLSYPFLVQEIAKTNKGLASKLDDFIVQDIKDKGQLIYTGLLLSNQNTSANVERNLNNDNPELIFISIGIQNPENFINLVFDKANELIANPSTL